MTNPKQTDLKQPNRKQSDPQQSYRYAVVDNLRIFYREAGSPDLPTIVLLHGYPSSSHMFRNLIPLLADSFHLIAPDYPGFGYSDAPTANAFPYTFDHLAAVVDGLLEQLKIDRYAIYIQDYGSPVGFRLALQHPDRIRAIVTQNGNAFEAGFGPFWDEYLRPFWANRNPQTEAKVRTLLSLEATKSQYVGGARNAEHLSPDAWTLDQALLDRPGNAEIQLDLLYDYRTNLPRYPEWQAYLRESNVPVLAVWGRNDPIFIEPGARAFRENNPQTELHLLDTGHFALEEDAEEIARLMRTFLGKLS